MKKKWLVIIILAFAQFVMVLDSTVMNVSLSTVASDLHTDITGMQVAITFYTLTMAAFMLTGGKLGDIWGRRRAFKIGAVVYGLGSLMTGLAPNLTILLLGWSLIEGLGAVLVIPAIAALAAVNYKGRDRVIAFAIIGGISGAAAAAGPLIGGFMTTYFSWRYVFIGETIIMAIILLVTNKIADEKVRDKQTIDVPSVLLSVAGMGILVYGLLQSKVWGWVKPISSPEFNGVPITPFGISLVAYMILTGIIILWTFYRRQKMLEAQGKVALLKVSLFASPVLRSGLAVLLFQYFTIAALFFVMPVYLQVVLGFDALQTGIKILPLSVGLILFSISGARLVTMFSARKIVRLGQICLILGGLVLMSSINEQLEGFIFGTGMFILGAGLGFLASQLGNVNMSAVGDKNSAEGGGLQGTFQNLGSSLGTALIGSLFITSLTTGFVSSIDQTTLPSNVKDYISTNAKSLQVISAPQAEAYAMSKGATQSEADEIVDVYTNAQIDGIRQALFYIVAFCVLSLLFSRNIPNAKPK